MFEFPLKCLSTKSWNILIDGKAPAPVHHIVEVLIILDVGGNTLVVLKEFLFCDLTIRFLITHSDGMSCFKGQREFFDDLVLCFSLGDDVWMLRNIKTSFKIINISDLSSIFVELIESLHNQGLSFLGHVASYSSDKLFK